MITQGEREQTVQAPPPASRWVIIPSTLLVVWVVGMIDKIGVAIIALNPRFLADMHLAGRPALIGLLVSVLLFTYGFAFPVWGFLVDRFGPKRCMLVGLAAWAISTLVAGLSVNFAMLVASRALLGVAEAYLWPVSNSLTARWFPQSERARAKSIWINGINLGLAIAGFVVTAAIGPFGWRGVFFVLTGLALLVCLPMAALAIKDNPTYPVEDHQRDPHDEAATQSQTTPATSLRATHSFGRLRYWLAVVAWIATTMGVFGLATWFPTYLKGPMRLSPIVTSDYIALAFGLCLVLTPIVGIVADKTHRKAIWGFGGFLAAAAALGVIAVVHTPGIGVAAVVVAILGIQGVTTLIGQGVMHSFTLASHMGRENGVMVGIANVIAAFGPTIMGALLGLSGFTLAFLFLIAIFVVGALSHVGLHRQGY
jgi:MFS family permease